MKKLRSLIATLLSLSILLSSAPFAFAQEQAPAPFVAPDVGGGVASAAASAVTGGGGSFLDQLGGSVKNLFSAKLGIATGGVPTNDIQTNLTRGETKFKFTLDGLAWVAVNRVIAGMTRSVVTWINNGFEGSPSFVTDPAGFFADVADQISGEYIQNLGLAGKLCSPFRAQILLSLTTFARTGGAPRYQCTLTRVAQNFQNFLADFGRGGGWSTWISLSRAQNNPYIRVMNEAEELARIQAVQAEMKRQELQWGNGFISTRNPYDPRKIDTPGSVIEAQLNNSLDASARRLEVADSVNELFSALAEQLVSKVITGARGLLGSSARSGTKPSYLDQVAAQQQADESFIKTGVTSTISTDIQLEQQYRALKDQALVVVRATRTQLETLRSCLLHPSALAGGGTAIPGFAQTSTNGTSIPGATSVPGLASTAGPLTPAELLLLNQLNQKASLIPVTGPETTNATALAAAASVLETINTKINPLEAALLQDQQVSQQFQSQLTSIANSSANAVTADQIAQLAATYQTQSASSHNETDITQAQQEITEVVNFATPIFQDAQRKLLDCRQGILR